MVYENENINNEPMGGMFFSGTLPLERPDVRASTDKFGKDIACLV